MDGTSGPSERPPFTGRAAYSISQLYYYLAAIVGVGFVLGGGTTALLGVRQLILPGPLQTTRQSVRTVSEGLLVALPGTLVLLWHLREAGRHEGRFVRGAFWGRALYYFGVAFVALIAALIASTVMLTELRDAVLPICLPRGSVTYPSGGVLTGTNCFPGRSEALRSALDALIVLLAAGALLLWHVRRGRLTQTVSPGD